MFDDLLKIAKSTVNIVTMPVQPVVKVVKEATRALEDEMEDLLEVKDDNKRNEEK